MRAIPAPRSLFKGKHIPCLAGFAFRLGAAPSSVLERRIRLRFWDWFPFLDRDRGEPWILSEIGSCMPEYRSTKMIFSSTGRFRHTFLTGRVVTESHPPIMNIYNLREV